MKKIFFTLVTLFIALISNCQTKEASLALNLNFEIVEKGIPTGWQNFGPSGYTISLDSANVKRGKYSVSIEFKEGTPNFKAWAFTLPQNYPGKKITLSGYIKTRDVTDGYAGLWMRIDPSIAFNNMKDIGVSGTSDWAKHEITLNMNPEKTDQIVIGGILTGKGKMWIDDFSVTIDGKDIKDLKPFIRELLLADKDKEFDEGSNIVLETISENQVEDLRTLGLIWGFMKYYHPNIAKGDYNWDYELFRILPDLLKAENKENRDVILTQWIDKFGQLEEGSMVSNDSLEVKFLPDLDWIENSAFSKELSTSLMKVKNASRQKEHYYIGLKPGVGNPDFKNEKPYKSMKYPDTGFRLLALYRYWNIIQYYFPYKNLIEEDWKYELEAFIPRVIEARNETEYALTILELIGKVHDTHANIWGGNKALKDYFGLNYSAVKLSFIENEPVVVGYYDDKLGKESGMQIGDQLTFINGHSVNEIVKNSLKWTPASNYSTQLRDISRNLLRTNDSTISIEFNRDDKKLKKMLKSYSTSEVNIYRNLQSSDTCFRMIDKNIAYINNGSLKRDDIPEIWRELENTKGLIIDIRNYPSDFPIYDLSSHLLSKSTPFVKFTVGSIESPGLLTYLQPLSSGKENKDFYKGKVVILVNEKTQSSAEFHAMAYQTAPNTTIIGSTTAGADGNVSQFNLPGGLSTMISGIGVYYPDGTETQRIGIIPDIELEPTIQGIIEGKDELMLKAIEIINKGL